MRRFSAGLAAASFLLAASAQGQTPAVTTPAATPAAPVAPPTAEERQRLAAATQRGIQLFELARAAQLTTQDMLARVPDPSAAGITGWIATPEGSGLTVIYYAEGPEGPVAAYRAQVLGGRIATPEIFTGAARPALSATQRRMAAARAAVATLDRQPCSGDFNVFVIPPAAADSPIEVYKLSPQSGRGRYPLGGHFLATVAPDGTVASTRAFANGCAELQAPADTTVAGRPAAPARPLAVTHLLDPLPTEIHVLLSLWMNRPLLVATGDPDRLWTVARGRIGLVGAAQVPPAGPGR
ncbi:MAG: hypothetical protein QOI38_3193 [Sphingomonadales bacterium]|jgi:hypothetical protein|nr:hypothetical protein [Sphingomonadales bacterium]